MENVNKQQGLKKISELGGEIKEIEHENSSDDLSSDNEKSDKTLANRESM